MNKLLKKKFTKNLSGHYFSLIFLLILPFASTYPLREPPTPVESSSVITGWFTIVWGDPAPNSESLSQEIFILTDDEGKVIQLHFNDPIDFAASNLLSLDRQRVSVQGTWIPSPEESFLSVNSISLESSLSTSSQERLNQAISGPQPWVSILCKFSDVPAEPNPQTFFQNMYANTYPALDHYWRELSYDQINVVGSGAFGWYTLPQPRSYYVYDMDSDGDLDLNHERAVLDCTGVADPFVYYPSYVGINMMFNETLDCCAWGGGWYLNLDGVSRTWRVTWEPPWGYQNIGIIEHEMGHGFGLPHSSGMYGETYDNQWDIMSDVWTNCFLATDPTYGCLGQHTISPYKDRLDWFSPSLIFSATSSNTPATVTLERLALPQTSNYRLINIPIQGDPNHFYSVEVRKLAGYDVKLPGQAVIIHEIINDYAYVLDVDGNGNTGDAGAMWTVGETFSDPANQISVSVDSETTSGFIVTVENSNAPTLPNDDFDTPTIISSMPFSDSLDTSTATSDPDDPPLEECSRNPGLATVWYRYTPPVSGILQVDTVDSNYDTMIAVWTGPRGALSPVACNDDYFGLQSYIETYLAPGTTYHIEVAQYDGELPSAKRTGDKPAPQSILAGGSLELHADFLPCYTLTTGVDPLGYGSVSPNPPPNCNDGTQYTQGTLVELTATENPGHTFEYWSGDAAGTQNPVNVMMDGNKTVTANFSSICYTLETFVNPSGGGTVEVTPSPNCNSGTQYTQDMAVELLAIPGSRSVFDLWSGDLGGSTNPAELIMDSDKSVTANFYPMCRMLLTNPPQIICYDSLSRSIQILKVPK
jgi:uncharacterized repeat protein (TIGR02543 family)